MSAGRRRCRARPAGARAPAGDTPSLPELPVAKPMERYAIVRTVGRGAFGTVMAARDTATGALVAVKRIRDALEDQDQCKLLQRELKLLRHLRGHENIINIQDIFVGPTGQADFTDIFIVTNKMDTDLSRVIWSAQTVSYEHVRYFAYQVLRGLKYLHSAQIMHRDLKPQNLLVDSNCDLRICDLGLARLIEHQDNDQTVYVVTRWYRAPELLLGKRDYDKSIDVWSCGCILAELLQRAEEPKGGRRFALWQGHNYVDMLKMQLETLGHPQLEDQQHLSAKARAFLAGDNFGGQRSGREWAELYPHAPRLAVDLLDKLLQFNPQVQLRLAVAFCFVLPKRSHTLLTKKLPCARSQKRLGAAQALAHPYFAKLHDPDDEPDCASAFDFKHEMNQSNLSEAATRACVFEEISKLQRTRRRDGACDDLPRI